MTASLLLSSLDLGVVTERHRIKSKIERLLDELKQFKSPDKGVNDVLILVVDRIVKEIDND